ncbi:MAG TPA: DUF1570 domain-containing protein, partial [Pirellulales bacterium]|nr:DUF1570 domain-containing protein [Pirellulales bacterium]
LSRLGVTALAWALVLGFTHAGRAQSPLLFTPQADPADFGLNVPDASPKPGGGRRVLVKSTGDELVVGKVLVEAGDAFVVIMPDGRLTSVPQHEATVTDRPFKAVAFDELGRQLTDTKFVGFKTHKTKRYLYVYNSSRQFFEATRNILETMYPSLFGYCRRKKIPVRDPDVPLVVIMFRTQDEFEKYHPMPEGVLAYYSGVSNHVVLYEQSKLLEVAPELAFKQAISTIAHEGVHQVLHNIGVQQRLSRWPMWISEGLPEYFAPTQIGAKIKWKGVGFPNDLRMKSLETLIKEGKGSQELVRPAVEADRLDATGYASAWALTHFLAERRREKFVSFLVDVSKYQPLEKHTPDENQALFAKYFGRDFAEFDTELVKHLSKLDYVDPILNQTHYVAMMQIGRGRKGYLVTTSPTAVEKWQQEELAKLSANLQSQVSFNIQPFPNRDTALAFAKTWLGR